MPETLTTVIDGHGAAWVTLNRPDVHNALDEIMIAELTAEMGRLAEDDGVRCIILGGEGKSFCAGADLNWMKRTSTYSQAENEADAARLAAMLKALNTSPKPLVGLVHGAAFGGGVGVAACCDVVVVGPKARFCLSEAKLGLVASVISPYVRAAMGESWARRYSLTSDVFGADDAVLCGLAHIKADDVKAEGERLASVFAANAPKAMAAVKELLFYEQGRAIDDDLIAETARRIAAVRASDEGKEGIASFLEKRNPNWRKG